MFSAVIKLIILISLFLCGNGEKARYDNYRVYEIFIETEDQINLMNEIQRNSDGVKYY